MCDCFHVVLPAWPGAPGSVSGRQLQAEDPDADTEEDRSVTEGPGEETIRPRPQGSSPVYECATEGSGFGRREDTQSRPGSSGRRRSWWKRDSGDSRTFSRMSRSEEATEVTLKTEVEAGASGYSVTGGGDQGIFVKQVLKGSSAAKLFSLREGDQLLSATVFFDHINYEDALKILQYSEPYKVQFKIKRKLPAAGAEDWASSTAQHTPKHTGTQDEDVAEGGTDTPVKTLERDGDQERLIAKSRGGRGRRAQRERLSWPKFQATRSQRGPRRSHSSSEAYEGGQAPDGSPTSSDTEAQFLAEERERMAGAGSQRRRRFLNLRFKTDPEDADGKERRALRQPARTAAERGRGAKPEGSPGLGDKEVVAHDSKFKMPKFRMPSFCTSGAATEASGDVSLPSIQADLKTSDLSIDLPSADVDIKTGELGVKLPEGHLPEGELEGRASGVGLKGHLPGVHLPSMKMPKVDFKGPQVDIKGPKLDLKGTKGEVTVPDMEVSLPSVDVDIQAPGPVVEGDVVLRDKEVATWDGKFMIPKFKMPSFGVSRPETNWGTSVDMPETLSTGEARLPSLEGEMRVRGGSLHVPSADLELPGGELQVAVPEGEVTLGEMKGKAGGARFKGHLPQVQMPSMKMPQVDFQGPQVDIKGPKLDLKGAKGEVTVPDMEVSLPSVEDIQAPAPTLEGDIILGDKEVAAKDSKFKMPKFKMPSFATSAPSKDWGTSVDMPLPKATGKMTLPSFPGETGVAEGSVQLSSADLQLPGGEMEVALPEGEVTLGDMKGKAEGARFKGHLPKVQMPSMKMPKVDFQGPQVDIKGPKVDLKDAKAERTARDMEVSLPSVEMGLQAGEDQLQGDIVLGGKHVATKDSKFKMPKFKMPSFGTSGPGKSIEASVDVTLPSIQTDIKTSDLSIDLPSADVDIKTGELGVKLPEGHLPEGELEGPSSGVGLKGHLPGVHLPSMKMPKVDFKGPQVDIKGPKLDLQGAKGEVSIPDMEVSLPSVEVDIQAPGAKVEGDIVVGDTEVATKDSKFKMPKFKMPSFGTSGPGKSIEASVDVSLPSIQTDIKTSDLSIDLPSADVDIKSGELGVKLPEGHLPEGELEGPASGVGLRGHLPGVHLPSMKMPKVDFQGPQVDIKGPKLDLKGAKAEVTVPEGEVKLGEVKGKAEGATFKGHMPQVQMPSMKMPKVDFKGPQVDIKGPKLDLKDAKGKVTIPDMEVSLPSVDVDIQAPGAKLEGDIVVGDIEVATKDSKFKMPKFKMPSFGTSGPGKSIEASVDVSLPSIQTDIKTSDPGIDLPSADVDIKTGELGLKLPEGHLPEGELEGRASGVGLKGHLPGVHLPSMKMPKVDFKGPQVDIKGPKIDLKGAKAEVTVPEGEVKLGEVKGKAEGATFKGHMPQVQMPSMKMPKVDFKGPQVDIKGPKVDLKDAKGKVTVPDMEVSLPSVDVDIQAPGAKVEGDIVVGDTEVATKDSKFKMPKFKMPSFGTSGPGKSIEASVDVTLPSIQTDIKTSDLSIDLPSADVDIKTGELGVKLPEGHLPEGELEGRTSGVGLRGHLPGVHLPSMKMPKVDFKGPQVDIKGPKLDLKGAKAEVTVPEGEVKLGEVKGKAEGATFKGHMPQVQMPSMKMPKVDFKGPQVDIKGPKLDLKGAKGKVTVPDMKVSLPSVDVDIQAPGAKVEGDIVVGDTEVATKDSKFKMPKFKMPSFGTSGPGKSIEASVDVSLPSIQTDIKTSDPGIDLPSADVDIKTGELGLKLPEGHLPEGELEGRASGVGLKGHLPGVHLPSMKMPKVDFKGPQVDIKGPKIDLKGAKAEVTVPEGEVKLGEVKGKAEGATFKGHMPQVQMPSMKMPKVDFKGPQVDIKGPKLDLQGAKAEVTVPDMEVSLPSVDVDIQAPGAKLEGDIVVGDIEVATKDSKFKMPKFKMPSFGTSGPGKSIEASVDVTLPSIQTDIKTSDLSIDLPSADVDIKTGELGVKLPEGHLPEGELEGRASGVGLKGHLPGVHLPSMKMPKVDFKGPQVDIKGPKLDLKDAKGKVTVPDMEVSLPSVEVDIQAPGAKLEGDIVVGDTEVATKDSKFKMPKFKMPSFGTSGPGKSIEASVDVTLPSIQTDIKTSDLSIDLPSADVDIKTGELGVKLPEGHLPEGELEGRASGVGLKGHLPGVHLPSMKMPKVDFKGPQVDIKGPKLDLKGAKAEVTVREGEVKLGEVKGKAEGATFKGHMPQVQMPSMKMPKVDFKGPQVDIKGPKLDLKDAKGKVTVPDMEVSLPSVEVDIQAPGAKLEGDIVVGDTEVATKDSKFKMPKFKMPSFGTSGPGKSIEASVDVTLPKAEADVSLPSIQTDIKTSDLSIDLPSADVDIKTGELGVKLPEGHLPEGELEGRASGVGLKGHLPGVHLPSMKMPKVDFKGPKVDIKGPKVDLKDAKGKVTVPDMEVSLPSVDVDIQAPGAKLEGDIVVGDIEVSTKDSKFKMPSFGTSGPGKSIEASVDVTLPSIQTDIKTSDLSIDLPSADVDIKTGELGLKLPEGHLPEGELEGRASGVGLKGHLPGVHLPSMKMPKVDFKGPQVDIKGPKLDLKGAKAEVTVPEGEVKLGEVKGKAEGATFKGHMPQVQMPSMKMPKVDFKGPQVDIKGPKLDLQGAKAEVTVPDMEVSLPSVEVDIQAPGAKLEGDIVVGDTEVATKDSKFKMPKFKMPSFGTSGPGKSIEASVDVTLPKAEADVSLPSIQTDIKTSDPGIDLPSADVDIKTGELGVKLPEGHLPEGELEGPASGVGLRGHLPGVHLPSMKMPKVDFKGPQVDIKGPKLDLKGAKAEVTVPEGEVKLGEVKGKAEGATFKGHMPQVQMPSMKMPKVDFKGPQVDIKGPKLDLKDAKGKVTVPDMEVSLPSVEVDIQAPGAKLEGDIVVGDTEVATKDSKFKMPKFKMPSFGTSGPGKSIEASVDVTLPSIQTDIKTSDLSIDLPSADVDIKSGELGLKLPEGHLPEGELEGPASGVGLKGHLPGVHLPSMKMPKVDFKGPQVDIKGPKLDLKGAKGEVSAPDLEVSLPSVEVEIQAPGSKLEGDIVLGVKGVASKDSKFKMPKFKMPSFGVSPPSKDWGTSVDVSMPQTTGPAPPPSLVGEIPAPAGSIHLPSADLELPGGEVAVPLTEGVVTLGELKGKGEGARFKGHLPKMQMPSIKVPKVDIKGPKLDLKCAKGEVTPPDSETSPPRVEVAIQEPHAKVAGDTGLEGKEVAARESKFKMPKVSMPFFRPSSSKTYSVSADHSVSRGDTGGASSGAKGGEQGSMEKPQLPTPQVFSPPGKPPTGLAPLGEAPGLPLPGSSSVVGVGVTLGEPGAAVAPSVQAALPGWPGVSAAGLDIGGHHAESSALGVREGVTLTKCQATLPGAGVSPERPQETPSESKGDAHLFSAPRAADLPTWEPVPSSQTDSRPGPADPPIHTSYGRVTFPKFHRPKFRFSVAAAAEAEGEPGALEGAPSPRSPAQDVEEATVFPWSANPLPPAGVSVSQGTEEPTGGAGTPAMAAEGEPAGDAAAGAVRASSQDSWFRVPSLRLPSFWRSSKEQGGAGGLGAPREGEAPAAAQSPGVCASGSEAEAAVALSPPEAETETDAAGALRGGLLGPGPGSELPLPPASTSPEEPPTSQARPGPGEGPLSLQMPGGRPAETQAPARGAAGTEPPSPPPEGPLRLKASRTDMPAQISIVGQVWEDSVLTVKFPKLKVPRFTFPAPSGEADIFIPPALREAWCPDGSLDLALRKEHPGVWGVSILQAGAGVPGQQQPVALDLPAEAGPISKVRVHIQGARVESREVTVHSRVLTESADGPGPQACSTQIVRESEIPASKVQTPSYGFSLLKGKVPQSPLRAQVQVVTQGTHAASEGERGALQPDTETFEILSSGTDAGPQTATSESEGSSGLRPADSGSDEEPAEILEFPPEEGREGAGAASEKPESKRSSGRFRFWLPSIGFSSAAQDSSAAAPAEEPTPAPVQTQPEARPAAELPKKPEKAGWFRFPKLGFSAAASKKSEGAGDEAGLAEAKLPEEAVTFFDARESLSAEDPEEPAEPAGAAGAWPGPSAAETSKAGAEAAGLESSGKAGAQPAPGPQAQ